MVSVGFEFDIPVSVDDPPINLNLKIKTINIMYVDCMYIFYVYFVTSCNKPILNLH